MQSYMVICFLIGMAVAESYVVINSDNILEYRKECVKELSVPAAHVEKFKKLEYPNDATTQCYLKCVSIKSGLFDTKHGFIVENIHQQLAGGSEETHDEELHAKIAACIDNNEQGSNACEWAYRGVTCLLKHNLPLIKKTLAPKA